MRLVRLDVRVTDEQLSLVEDVPHARSSDPGTSWAAGRATEAEEGTTSTIRPWTGKHYALILLAESPKTAVELERVSHRRGIWKRVSDLKNAGLIEDVGTRHDPLTDRDGLVWTPNELGLKTLEILNRGEVVTLNERT